jgi:hypothetical protein
MTLVMKKTRSSVPKLSDVCGENLDLALESDLLIDAR